MSNEVEVYEGFDLMGLKDNLLRGILSYGYEKPSVVQTKGIVPVIKGNDCVIQAQSGTGKTATFSIAALEIVNKNLESCQVIILNPTREIADQTLNVVKRLGHYLNYNIDAAIGGKKLNMNTISNAQIIVATPGRIYDIINRGLINMESLKILILDEADQMLDKGFKEQLNDIFQYINPDKTQISIYSATMPNDIIFLTDKFMRDPLKILIKKENLTLEGIKQFYIFLQNEHDKYVTLIDLYQTLFIGQSIIYCNSKKKVIWLNEQLNEQGYSISFIHGDMLQKERDEIMIKFRKNLTALHVNSGSCSFTDTVAEVCVFRAEECLKVLFHECIHALRFSRIGVCKTVDDVYGERYNLNSKDILLDETYTEIWARLLNCYYVSQFGSGNALDKFCSCVALEKIFSLYQANKIIMPLASQNTAKQNRAKRTMKRVLPRRNLDKYTNVTAYYLGSAEVFQHLNEFLQFTDCEPYLKDTTGFRDFMKGECQKIPKMKIDPKDRKHGTMRMTVIELEI